MESIAVLVITIVYETASIIVMAYHTYLCCIGKSGLFAKNVSRCEHTNQEVDSDGAGANLNMAERPNV